MTNPVHLLVSPSSPQACALLMRNLGQRYVQYFNRRYGRTGTLWEGRFRSCLVDTARYVLACHRYIELNPVRAGMVRSVSEYRWSSHNVNAGRASDALLTRHAECLALGVDDASRHAAYQGLFASGDDPAFVAAIRDATNGGYALVGEELKSRLPLETRRRLERRPPGPTAKVSPQQDESQLSLSLS
jgi:putative transposase